MSVCRQICFWLISLHRCNLGRSKLKLQQCSKGLNHRILYQQLCTSKWPTRRDFGHGGFEALINSINLAVIFYYFFFTNIVIIYFTSLREQDKAYTNTLWWSMLVGLKPAYYKVIPQTGKSLMAKWLERESQWHEMFRHDLEVISLNPIRIELGVPSTSVLSRTWIKNMYKYQHKDLKW